MLYSCTIQCMATVSIKGLKMEINNFTMDMCNIMPGWVADDVDDFIWHEVKLWSPWWNVMKRVIDLNGQLDGWLDCRRQTETVRRLRALCIVTGFRHRQHCSRLLTAQRFHSVSQSSNQYVITIRASLTHQARSRSRVTRRPTYQTELKMK